VYLRILRYPKRNDDDHVRGVVVAHDLTWPPVRLSGACLLALSTVIASAIDDAWAQTGQSVESRSRESVVAQSDTARSRGRELLIAIEKLYAEMPLEKRRGLQLVPPSPATEISDALKQYIPIGMSFDDAEAILEQAGFQIIQPRKTSPSSSHRDLVSSYDVVAVLRRTTDVPPTRMDVHVVLRPKGILDYRQVAGLWARTSKQEIGK
jgi:hypothetical protein